FELLLCHGTVCVVGKMRDLILQLSKSSIYSTNPLVLGKREVSLTVPPMENLFAMMELLVNPKKSVLKTHDNFCFYICV
ncbi:hypothetical protein BHE88_13450, partial [Shigella sp. FC1737]